MSILQTATRWEEPSTRIPNPLPISGFWLPPILQLPLMGPKLDRRGLQLQVQQLLRSVTVTARPQFFAHVTRVEVEFQVEVRKLKFNS